MKKILGLAAAMFMVTLIGGCGTGTVPVKITNDLGAWDIEEIYIDLSSEPWGVNRITETIEPGEDVTIRVPAGTYDLKIVDEDGDTYTIWGKEISADGFNWAVTLSDLD